MLKIEFAIIYPNFFQFDITYWESKDSTEEGAGGVAFNLVMCFRQILDQVRIHLADSTSVVEKVTIAHNLFWNALYLAFRVLVQNLADCMVMT